MAVATQVSPPAATHVPGVATRRFLTFRVEDRLYALPAEEVTEVIRMPALARVPHAPKGLLGVANLRGTVLPVAGLRGLLGLGEAPATRALVLDGAAPVALAVDAVAALVTVAGDRIETRPAELAARPGERLRGAFAVGDTDTVASIVDIAALIAAAFVAQDRPRHRHALSAAGRSATVAGANDERRRLVSFEVAGQEFALDLGAVQEIIDAPISRAALPASDGAVLGVASFRGTLLPLLSLRGLLGFAEPAQPTGREKVVVARIGTALIGLMADRMRTLFAADADLIEEVPPVLAARIGGEARVTSIYRGEGGRRLVSLLEPRTLFKEEVMQRFGNARSAVPAGADAPPQERGEERQFVVFRLGDDEFALPIEAVNEVARVPAQITRVPKTPKFLEGVINLRGEVLPVVDQRRRFDLPALADGRSRRLLVVRTENHRAGLIVDSVSEVMRCFADEIEPAPSLTGEKVRLVEGVINLEGTGRIVLVLDPAELLTRAERGLLDALEKPHKARP
ncbi:chemotaxis protein CheW [Reyranella sp.]|uniref:chemotaxis protein CheW n=1 Tax=Reyranella sp. TaxID=1929291 RepID=UPI003D0DCF8B